MRTLVIYSQNYKVFKKKKQKNDIPLYYSWIHSHWKKIDAMGHKKCPWRTSPFLPPEGDLGGGPRLVREALCGVLMPLSTPVAYFGLLGSTNPPSWGQRPHHEARIYSEKYLGIQREDSEELAGWVRADHSTPALTHGLAGVGVPGDLPPQSLALITVSPQGLWAQQARAARAVTKAWVHITGRK